MSRAALKQQPTMSAGAPRLSPRRGLRLEEAAQYVGVSPTKFRSLVDQGRMPQSIAIDGCRVWDIRKLDLAFDLISDDDSRGNPWD